MKFVEFLIYTIISIIFIGCGIAMAIQVTPYSGGFLLGIGIFTFILSAMRYKMCSGKKLPLTSQENKV
jgi:hypothetical protein